MNYEELYARLTPLEKELKDSVSSVTKHNKAIIKAMETGCLTDLKKAVQLLSEAAEQMKGRIENYSECVEQFDVREYFMSGDFAEQLVACSIERGIDVTGSKGIYEMFPYKVRVAADDEHFGEVYVNRKKITSARPSFVAGSIAAGRDKLYREKFNEQAFMNELSEAYDTTLLKSNARPGANLLLAKIYKTMVPMARARKDYDMQAFSFDLARLYEMGPDAWVTKTGRQFAFGTSRDGKSGIRVLSSSGVESYITTLKAFDNN